MKKTFTLFLIFALMILPFTMVSASSYGFVISGSEDSTGLVSITVSLRGPVSNINGIAVSLSFDKSVIKPAKKDGTIIPEEDLYFGTPSGYTGYVDFKGSFANWEADNGGTVAYWGDGYDLYNVGLQSGVSSNYITLENNQITELFTFYFKRVGKGAIKSALAPTESFGNLTNGSDINVDASAEAIDVSSIANITDYTPGNPKVEKDTTAPNGGDSTGGGETLEPVTVYGKSSNFTGTVGAGAILLKSSTYAANAWHKLYPALDHGTEAAWTRTSDDEAVPAYIVPWQVNGQFAVTLTGLDDAKLEAGTYYVGTYQDVGGTISVISGTVVPFTKTAAE
jgi:hypothetical protein